MYRVRVERSWNGSSDWGLRCLHRPHGRYLVVVGLCRRPAGVKCCLHIVEALQTYHLPAKASKVPWSSRKFFMQPPLSHRKCTSAMVKTPHIPRSIPLKRPLYNLYIQSPHVDFRTTPHMPWGRVSSGHSRGPLLTPPRTLSPPAALALRGVACGGVAALAASA